MSARQWLGWIAATLVIAALVHVGTVAAIPHLIMHRMLAQAGTVNVIHFGKRPDASARGVVRPSPDLLYSICPFDLSKGPLRVRSPVPSDTYWSVSAFDANTDNFFVKNDRQVSGAIDFLIVAQGDSENTEGFSVVRAPTARGLVLFRTLIDDDGKLAAIDALRRKATCETWYASPADVSSKAG
jgi:uncharacterized membrane protein